MEVPLGRCLRLPMEFGHFPMTAERSLQFGHLHAVFGNLTGEDARPTLWRGRPRPRLTAGRSNKRDWPMRFSNAI
jgi:hypothetical protein